MWSDTWERPINLQIQLLVGGRLPDTCWLNLSAAFRLASHDQSKLLDFANNVRRQADMLRVRCPPAPICY